MIKLELNKINVVLLFVIVYFMTIRRYTNADEILIVVLGILVLIERIKEKNYFLIDKRILIISIVGFLILMFSYYQVNQILDLSEDIIENRQNKELFNVILFKYFLFGSILSQMKLKEKYKIYIMYFINFCSLYVIYKGIEYGIKYSFFRRCDLIWRQANYLSMMLGVFSIIAFVSILVSKKIQLKVIFTFIFTLHLFLLVMIGQSRNVLASLILCLFIIIFIFYKEKLKKIELKKIIMVIIIGSIIIYFFIEHASSLRVIRGLDFDIIKNDTRILLWKNALQIIKNNKVSFFKGMGFGYFIVEKIYVRNEILGSFHNDILEIIITQGYLNALNYFLFLIISSYIFLKEYIRKEKEIYLLTFALILYVFLTGLLDNIIYSDRVIQFMVLFIFMNLPKKCYNLNKNNSTRSFKNE